MRLDRRARAFNLTIRCLFALWLFFGSLELLETLQLVPETGIEDQRGQDPDEDALAELESGLKSKMPRADDNSSVILAIVEPPLSVSFATFDPLTHQTLSPPSLPLYQQFSVYRI